MKEGGNGNLRNKVLHRVVMLLCLFCIYIYTAKKCKEKVYISVHFPTILDHQKLGSIPSECDFPSPLTGFHGFEYLGGLTTIL